MEHRHFECNFRGIASKKKRKGKYKAPVAFKDPHWLEIQLLDVREISHRDTQEDEAGIFFRPESTGKEACPIFIENKKGERLAADWVRNLICYPSVGNASSKVRHVHALSMELNTSDQLVWTGRARFSYPWFESGTGSELDEQGDPVNEGLNKDPFWQKKNAGDIPQSAFRSWSRRTLPRVFLLLGILLLFVNPILGACVLGWAFYSLSRDKGSAHTRVAGQDAVKRDASLQEVQKNTSQAESTTDPSISARTTGAPSSASLGGKILWFIGSGILLYLLWSAGSVLFWPLLISFVMFLVIGRTARRGWWQASRIFFFLFFILSIIFLLGEWVGASSVGPETRGDGRARTEVIEDGASKEKVFEHQIDWEDPLVHSMNHLAYRTANTPYRNSLNAHQRILHLGQYQTVREFWNKAYTLLLTEDNKKVDSLANRVYEVAKKRGYNSLETSEYLVSLIQEIPYVLVHDQSCQEVVNEGGFVREYHIERRPCLPNVVAGVQSPYEFMHTLKGDCDTRSLLAHAVLKKLRISSSVWISEQYGHSILGVGVAVPSGTKKQVGGIPHYGVELTAKGFRVGMISPDQRNMRNWEIAVYKNF